MDDYRNDLVKYRLQRAADELELSRHCIQVGIFSKSLNCSYYAIFHSARSLLALERIDFKKHSAVISYFIKNFINTQILPQQLGEIIRTAERERNKSDYQDFFIVTKYEADEQLKNALHFNHTIRKYLKAEFSID